MTSSGPRCSSLPTASPRRRQSPSRFSASGVGECPSPPASVSTFGTAGARTFRAASSTSTSTVTTSTTGAFPASGRPEFPSRWKTRHLLLVDDVLFTGRTVRAALTALSNFGRPRSVRLAVMVDRGGRELPIAADFVGLRVRADDQEMVRVRVEEEDGEDGVVTVPRGEGGG